MPLPNTSRPQAAVRSGFSGSRLQLTLEGAGHGAKALIRPSLTYRVIIVSSPCRPASVRF
jgi:hypothetical protein